MKKRVIAALLAVVMLFGMLPMSVFAENGIDTYSSHTNSHTYTKSGTHETWKKLR